MTKGFYLRLASGNIRKHRKIYYPYMLTAVLTVMMLYMISSLAGNAELDSETLTMVLGLGQWVTTIFSVIFLFYTNSFLMKRRKMEFGLLNILGMEKKHISRVVCCETLMILLLSLILGLGFGMLLDKLMYMVLLKLLGGPINGPAYYVSIPALAFASIIVTAVFCLILLNSIRQIHIAKPVELLHGGQVGEKEPKAKWLLAVIGVLLVGGGYCISIMVTNVMAAIMLFFVAVVMVILGTYLLYTAGSVTLLKAMRKNKRFYYQPDHFVNVSGMIYRMKQNAVGLANISILGTMVLVLVFSTCSLWFGMQDMLDNRNPTDVVITLGKPDQWDENRQLINDTVSAQGQTMADVQDYRFLSFSGYRKGNTYLTKTSDLSDSEALFGDGLTLLFVISLADYNRMTGDGETLDADEILLDIGDNTFPGDTLSVLNRDYRIKGRFLNDFILNDMAAMSPYTVQWLVLPDQAAMDELDVLQREVYGRHSSSQRQYMTFNLEGASDQAAVDCADAILDVLNDRELGYLAIDSRQETARNLRELYGGLLFIGLFLGLLFIMAMILIVYYKQISEGYDDKERFHIMRKVGLSRQEIRRSINAQIMLVFFLPLLTAGVHTACSFPSITNMFKALGMFNIPLMIWCLVGSFLLFAALYAVVYKMTAKIYYRIVS